MLNAQTIATLEAAYTTGGAHALIDAATEAGTNHIDIANLWAAAMTAHYGPTGMHKAWKNADDTPSAEALVTFPNVARAVETARERITAIFALMHRRVAA